jgi:hypothetical protein
MSERIVVNHLPTIKFTTMAQYQLLNNAFCKEGGINGATTFNIITFSIMTSSLADLIVTLSMKDTWHKH